MKRVGTALKIGITNVVVFLVLLWTVNFIASLYLDGRYLYKQVFVPIDEKAYSPSLKDQDSARLIYREKKQLKTRYVPFIAWSRKPFSGETITINSEGDRIHPLTTDQPRKIFRFFGGSTMWGTGVDDHNTIPAHFNALHQDFHVYNHGESGFVSRQEVARLINLVNQQAPMDVVIFYDGCNDCRSLCRADVSINGTREEHKIIKKMEHRWQVLDALFGSIQPLISKVVKEGKRPPSRCRDNPDYAKKVASTLVNNWKIAKAVAALGGAEFHAILQPVAAIGNPNIEYLKKRRDDSDWNMVYPFVKEIQDKENYSWVHDLTDAFDVDEYLYIDGCHVNGLGNRIIAQKISERLDLQPSR